MSVVISFFNHKGGVGKTTTVHNLSAALADKGKKVLVIDADPQMNLTASVYGIPLDSYYDNIGNNNDNDAIDLFSEETDALANEIEYIHSQESTWHSFQSKYLSFYDYLASYLYDQETDKPIFRKTSSNDSNGYVDLISGSIHINKLEAEIYRAVTNQLPGDFRTINQFQNLLDSLKSKYDFILIDTQPSASSIVMGLLVMMSDYFISPVIPSFYSLQAIDNLSDIIQNWISLLAPFKKTSNTNGIVIKSKFLGIIVQQAKRYKDYSQATVSWAALLNERLENYRDYALDIGRIVTPTEFTRIFADKKPYVIEMCYDFTANLRSIAEKSGVPVIHLTQDLCNKYKERGKQSADITNPDAQYYKSFHATYESYDRLSESLIVLLDNHK